MMSFLCLVVAAAFMVVVNATIDCNNKQCPRTAQLHTMCRYPDPHPAADCGTVLSLGLSDHDRKDLLDLHNNIRNVVASGLENRGNPGPQPPAANMPQMVWDDELAEIAQRWTNQCQDLFDRCRDASDALAGQNRRVLKTTGDVTFTPWSAVESWYDNVIHMNSSDVSALSAINAPKVVSYTHIVWAKTTRLGCGKIVYQRGSWKYYHITCNYAPQGTHIGEPVYEIKK